MKKKMRILEHSKLTEIRAHRREVGELREEVKIMHKLLESSEKDHEGKERQLRMEILHFKERQRRLSSKDNHLAEQNNDIDSSTSVE